MYIYEYYNMLYEFSSDPAPSEHVATCGGEVLSDFCAGCGAHYGTGFWIERSGVWRVPDIIPWLCAVFILYLCLWFNANNKPTFWIIYCVLCNLFFPGTCCAFIIIPIVLLDVGWLTGPRHGIASQATAMVDGPSHHISVNPLRCVCGVV